MYRHGGKKALLDGYLPGCNKAQLHPGKNAPLMHQQSTTPFLHFYYPCAMMQAAGCQVHSKPTAICVDINRYSHSPTTHAYNTKSYRYVALVRLAAPGHV